MRDNSAIPVKFKVNIAVWFNVSVEDNMESILGWNTKESIVSSCTQRH